MISATKWFLGNYLGWLIVTIVFPIIGIYTIKNEYPIFGIIIFSSGLIFSLFTFLIFIRRHYTQCVRYFKIVKRFKSNFLHNLFLN
jgi:hypothetical protein